MTVNTIEPVVTRVRFRERQLLRAVDLEDEQSYLITTRRRHNIGPHGWGILSGLELTRSPDGIVLEPGVAVDGYGRELIVPSPILIPPDAFNALKQKRLDVWLFYDLVEANVPQRGARDCGPGRNTRNRERASLRLTRAPVVSKSDGARASRTPAAVPFADLPFPPSRTSPDDPAREWPVYLGRIRRRKKRGIFRNAPRAYASLTGELVSAASATARMQVDSELESDTRRFAVSIVDTAGKWNERLAVDRAGNTIVTGNTAIKTRAEEAPPDDVDARIKSDAELPTGQLRLRENKDPNAAVPAQAIEPLCARSAGTTNSDKPGSARMVHFESLGAEPAAAAPWNVYRTASIQEKREVQQLRFEIGHPADKGDPKLSKLVVGRRRGEAKAFSPWLTVSADCNVTIDGDLEVLGELSQGPITPDPADPDFRALIASQWAEGTVIGQVTVAPGTIRIVVVRAGEAAVPIPGATVDIKNVQKSFQSNGTTDPTGVIAFSPLPDGRYNIRIVAPGFITVTKNDVEVPAGAGVSIMVEMTAPGTIHVSVLDGTGAAVADAEVVIRNLDTGDKGGGETDDEGQFTLLNMPPGRYSAATSAVGEVFQEGDLAEGGTLDLTLRPPAIS
jgi:Carboxypeptidase regulatory-like domain